MADFSSTEKVNTSWKHLFGILGTSNGAGAAGKTWYEENLAASHITLPSDIWTTGIPVANNITQALASVGTTVENRTSGENITLVQNGVNWDISTTTTIPKVGHQITKSQPNPVYIKSITNVVDNGGGNYTISLNSNTGVTAGSAVLQGRVYLTLDPTSNGKAWFSRKEYGNSFSSLITDFIHPQQFGKGYSVRLFQSNGIEINTTDGAWIFHNQKGIVLFADGFTASDLGYSQPLYIQGFRYTGAFGVGTSLPGGNINDTLRFDGTSWIPTSAVKSDGTNLGIQNRLTVSGSIVVPSGTPPSTSGIAGDLGEVRWDNNFMYIKTAVGWARTDISYF